MSFLLQTMRLHVLLMEIEVSLCWRSFIGVSVGGLTLAHLLVKKADKLGSALHYITLCS